MVGPQMSVGGAKACFIAQILRQTKPHDIWLPGGVSRSFSLPQELAERKQPSHCQTGDISDVPRRREITTIQSVVPGFVVILVASQC